MKRRFGKNLGIAAVMAAIILCLAIGLGICETKNRSNFDAVIAEVGSGTDVCEAKSGSEGMYDLLTDEVIVLYEREIAGEKVASNKSAQWLNSMADRFGVCVNKLKAALLLSDLSSRVGEGKSFAEIAVMNDLAIIVYAKRIGDKYLSTLSEERREELKAMALAAIGK